MFEHVKQYRGPDAYEDMFKCLDVIFGKENIKTMIEKMQKAKKTRELGKKFEAERLKRDENIKKWFDPVKAIAETEKP